MFAAGSAQTHQTSVDTGPRSYASASRSSEANSEISPPCRTKQYRHYRLLLPVLGSLHSSLQHQHHHQAPLPSPAAAIQLVPAPRPKLGLPPQQQDQQQGPPRRRLNQLWPVPLQSQQRHTLPVQEAWRRCWSPVRQAAMNGLLAASPVPCLGLPCKLLWLQLSRYRQSRPPPWHHLYMHQCFVLGHC